MKNNGKLGELLACVMVIAGALAFLALTYMAWPGYY